MIAILGLEIFKRANASGIALLTCISQYYKIWFKVLRTISFPISSLEAIRAIAITATY